MTADEENCSPWPEKTRDPTRVKSESRTFTTIPGWVSVAKYAKPLALSMRAENELLSPRWKVSDPVIVCPATGGRAERLDRAMMAMARIACEIRVVLGFLSRIWTNLDILIIFDM